MRPTEAYIYYLICPKTSAVKYVGKAKNPKKRFQAHMRDGKSASTSVGEWVSTLNGLAPLMRVVEFALDWDEAEKRHIKMQREQGSQLLNKTDGGMSSWWKCSNSKGSPHKVLIRRLANIAIELKVTGDVAGYEKFMSYSDGIRKSFDLAKKAGINEEWQRSIEMEMAA